MTGAAVERLSGWASWALGGLVALTPGCDQPATLKPIVADVGLPASIPREQAVDRAVRFVTEQGYTSAVVHPTEDRLVREALETMPIAQVMNARKNQLALPSIGTMRSREGWIIAFRYTVQNDPDSVRAVHVSNDGLQVYMHAEPMRVAWFEPLK